MKKKEYQFADSFTDLPSGLAVASLIDCPYGCNPCSYHDTDDEFCLICLNDVIKELKRYIKKIKKELSSHE